MQGGGPLMWPLLVCSAAVMAAVVERLIMLRRKRVMPERVLAAAMRAEGDGDVDALLLSLRSDDSPLARILTCVAQNRRLPRDEADAQVEAVGRVEARRLARRLIVLEAVYVVAPMLGLLGTIMGLMVIFQDFSATAASETRAFSRGIAMALLTTVAGLAIAIPSYLAHIYFSRRVEDLTLELENHAARLSSALRRQKQP